MNPRTMAALLAIPALVEIVETGFVHGTPPPSQGKRGKPASRPPVPLGIVSDLDEAFTLLTNAARSVARHADVTAPQPLWSAVCSFLTTHLESTSESRPDVADWVRIEYNINTAYDQVAYFAIWEEPEWRPIMGRWTCPFEMLDDGEPIPDTICGGPLLESTAQKVIWCPHCRRRWEGDLQYRILGQQLNVSDDVTITQAALITGLSERTIKRWIAAAHLQLPTRNGRVILSRRQLEGLIHAREVVS